jgi:magnesium transporter
MYNVDIDQTIERIDPENATQIKEFVRQATSVEISEFINFHWPSGKNEKRKLLTLTFSDMPAEKIVQVFANLNFDIQYFILHTFSVDKITLILNAIAPDDRTALFSKIPQPLLGQWLELLSEEEKQETLNLLSYDEESIGRLMTTDFIAVKPEWTCQEAIDFVRKHGKKSETINVIYVIDQTYQLIDDLQIGEVLLADPSVKIKDIADYRYVSLNADYDQEKAIKVFKETDRYALPVTDFNGTLLGIVTVDDLLDVMEREDTEDIPKLGGSEALDEPYFSVDLFLLIKKRAGWLIVLFFGLMLTATAMSYFEDAIASAVVLSLFIPLIIASGGNSGAQAATIITRSLALDEISTRDWWRVLRREFIAGIALGLVLGTLGFLRVVLWGSVGNAYGEHWLLLSFTIGMSLVGVVLWGTLMGSLLPILLKRLGFDPAVSSVPFVSSLVDVTGILIYFSVAYLFLKNAML